jgi:hypothetical protein
MSEYNAIVKKHGIKLTDNGEKILFWMELELPNNGGVGFVTEASTEDGSNSTFAHSISEVMKILDVDDFDNIDGRPLIAVFDGEMFIGSKLIGIKHFLDKYSFMY